MKNIHDDICHYRKLSLSMLQIPNLHVSHDFSALQSTDSAAVVDCHGLSIILVNPVASLEATLESTASYVLTLNKPKFVTLLYGRIRLVQ